jgi:xylulokinase
VRRDHRKLGGPKKTIKALGNAVLPGFTASKILWLKNHEPKNFRQARHGSVAPRLFELLAHRRARDGIRRRQRHGLAECAQPSLVESVLDAIDSELADKLPQADFQRPTRRETLQANTARSLGLNPGVLVSAGGGDNMMGAIGTGNTREGIITASFGTSGTIYACANEPVIDPEGEIAAFCDSTNRWLPLLCTMNVTVATEMMRQDFGYTHEQFENKAVESSRRLGRVVAVAVSRRRTHAQRPRRHRRDDRHQHKNF